MLDDELAIMKTCFSPLWDLYLQHLFKETKSLANDQNALRCKELNCAKYQDYL